MNKFLWALLALLMVGCITQSTYAPPRTVQVHISNMGMACTLGENHWRCASSAVPDQIWRCGDSARGERLCLTSSPHPATAWLWVETLRLFHAWKEGGGIVCTSFGERNLPICYPPPLEEVVTVEVPEAPPCAPPPPPPADAKDWRPCP